jgi:uncharacterized FAD-dependent dehydrogenase
MEIYDVIFVGSGVANLFAAMELSKKCKVLVLEKARRLNDSRNVNTGWFGGLARCPVNVFLDPGFGGSIQNQKVLDLFKKRLETYTATSLRVSSPKVLKKTVQRLEQTGISVFEPQTISLTEDKMDKLGKLFYKHLKENCTVLHKINVEAIHYINSHFEIDTNDGIYKGHNVCLGIGRGGANWLGSINHNLNLKHHESSFELGVRINTSIKSFYELFGKTPFWQLKFDEYKTTVPTIQGLVEAEEHGNLKMANGRSSSQMKHYMCNFGLLKTIKSENASVDSARLVEIANVLADGQILKEPILKLLSGQSILSPIKEYDELRYGLEKLISQFPELRRQGEVYFPECRINTVKYKVSNSFESEIPGLYILGDMSGHTKSFAQAASSGLLAAKNITKKR